MNSQTNQANPNNKPGYRRARKIAIVGGGMIAQVHWRAAILAGAAVAGVLGRTPEDSAAMAAKWGCETAFGSIEELVSRQDIEVVHICTPNVTHAAYAAAALEAGKSVICEKPLATTVVDASRLADLARKCLAHGQVAAVPFVYRYYPVVREIRARLQAGDLGEVLSIHGSYLQDWMLSKTAGWRVDPLIGGQSRAFADIGSHWFDLVEWVIGQRVESLVAQTSIAVAERKWEPGPSFGADRVNAVGDDGNLGEAFPVTTEDTAMVLAHLGSGAVAAATISQVSAGRKNRLWFEIDASRCSAVFNQEHPETVWFGGTTSSEVFTRSPIAGAPEQRRLSQLPAGHPQGFAQCFEAFVADVYSACDGINAEGLPTFEDGLRAAQITNAVLSSEKSHQWQEVSQ